MRHLTLRLPIALHKKLVKRAKEEHRSLNTMIILLLEECLKE